MMTFKSPVPTPGGAAEMLSLIHFVQNTEMYEERINKLLASTEEHNKILADAGGMEHIAKLKAETEEYNILASNALEAARGASKEIVDMAEIDMANRREILDKSEADLGAEKADVIVKNADLDIRLEDADIARIAAEGREAEAKTALENADAMKEKYELLLSKQKQLVDEGA